MQSRVLFIKHYYFDRFAFPFCVRFHSLEFTRDLIDKLVGASSPFVLAAPPVNGKSDSPNDAYFSYVLFSRLLLLVLILILANIEYVSMFHFVFVY